jgi:YegS/Rv2252/BmrU family lipid kinase
MKPNLLIYNPAAGGMRARRVEQLQADLAKRGIEVVKVATTGPGHATALAREAVERGDQLLIVCGGDGTINEAAQPLVGTATALAVLPSGTANVLAKELGLPRSTSALADLIERRETRTISVGRASRPGWRRYFLLMAGIGLDAAIVEGVNLRLKRATGPGAYWAAGLEYLARLPLTPFSVAIDGERREVTFALIANAARYGGWFSIAPEARIDDQYLDVCLFNTRRRIGWLAYALLSLAGAHTRRRGVVYQKTSTVLANSNDQAPVQLDGEAVGRLPMRFEVVPQALHVIAPRPG